MRNRNTECFGMYTLTRGRTKVITQSRRDAFQTAIELEKRDLKLQKRDSNSDDSTSSDGPPPLISPRPVFNGRKQYRMNSTMTQSQEPLTPHHEENIRYVSEVWNQVEKDITNATKRGDAGPVYYREKSPNPHLANFEPFDLESWWGQRTFQKITQST